MKNILTPFYADDPHPNAPDFVKARINGKADEIIKFVNTYKNEKGYVNMQLNRSKEGKLYLAVDPYGNHKLQAMLSDADHVNGKDDGEAPKDGHYSQRMRERVAETPTVEPDLQDIPF